MKTENELLKEISDKLSIIEIILIVGFFNVFICLIFIFCRL